MIPLCFVVFMAFITAQEREQALSLFEEGAPTLAATSNQVTVKGPDYNELVISVNKCCSLIPNTSGIHVTIQNCQFMVDACMIYMYSLQRNIYT